MTATATELLARNVEANRSKEIEDYLDSRHVKWQYFSNVSPTQIDRERSLQNQARTEAPLMEDLVEEYILAVEAGNRMPPVLAWRNDSSKLELMDGNHRNEVAIRTQGSLDVYECDCPADVRVLITLEANLRHGRTASHKDRERAALYAIDNGMTLPQAARRFLIDQKDLRKAATERQGNRRADDAGVSRTVWDALKVTIRYRLVTIALNNVFAAASNLAAEARLNQSDVNRFVTEINGLRDADAQMAVVERWKADYAEAVAAGQVTGDGRANLKFMGPRTRIRMVLGQVQSIVSVDGLIDSVPAGERPQLIEGIDAAIGKLHEIRNGLAQ